MAHKEDTVRNSIQALGSDAFPDDEVSWTVKNIISKDDYVFTEVEPLPNTVGYDKYVFVLTPEKTETYTIISCFVLDNGQWDLLFTDPRDTNDWTAFLNNV